MTTVVSERLGAPLSAEHSDRSMPGRAGSTVGRAKGGRGAMRRRRDATHATRGGPRKQPGTDGFLAGGKTPAAAWFKVLINRDSLNTLAPPR